MGLEWPLAGVTWFGHHAPHSSLFVPLYTATQQLPASWQRGTLLELRRENAWWAFASVTNLAEKMYVHMQQDVMMEQRTREAKYQKHVRELDHKLASSDPTSALSAVTDFTRGGESAGGGRVVAAARPADVQVPRRPVAHLAATLPINSDPLFYPVWWLQAVGYFVGDIPGTTRRPLTSAASAPRSSSSATLPTTAVSAACVAAPSGARPLVGAKRRRTQAVRGIGGEPFERSAFVSRSTVAAGVRRWEAVEEWRLLVDSGAVGGIDSGRSGGCVVVWLLCMCCVLCCYVAFCVGRRYEQRKQYQLIY